MARELAGPDMIPADIGLAQEDGEMLGSSLWKLLENPLACFM